MANQKLIKIIKEEGIVAWNEWRNVNPDAKINLGGANLSRADLSGADLSGANLFKGKLSGAKLSGAKLSRAKLSRAKLSGVNLSRADLSGVNLSRADLSGAKLIEADLSGADLSGAKLIEADLSGADLIEADLSGADLSGAKLIEADLSGAKLIEADLEGAKLIEADLSGADLSGADLSGADLSGADLIEADLEGAKLIEADLFKVNLEGVDLEGADLIEADLEGANLFKADLEGANLFKANLFKADLRGANLFKANLFKADLFKAKLTGAKLRGAKLIEADLRGADLSGVDLSGVDLSGANLSGVYLKIVNFSRVQALNTNFDSATLTGACIQDWNINSETNLDKVICEYIYLKGDQQERRPSDPNRNFEPGEFTKLFQKAIETVDLVFREGVNWKATAFSIKKTQILNQDTPLDIQSIEKKGDGVVVIKVNVPQNANKGKIEGDFWQGYEFAQKTLKEQYEARILDKDKHINQLFYSLNQAQEKLGEVPKLMAEQPKFQQNFNAHVTAVAQNVEGNQIINASEEKQTLAEAAQEIQNLVKQLEQTNPTATEEQQKAWINAGISPTIKQRCIGALMAGGETTIEEFLLDNSYLKILKELVKGWMNPDG